MTGAGAALRIAIDAEGRAWPADSDALHQHLDYPDPDFDLVGYAVRNAGYVLVELPQAASQPLVIEFRASVVKMRSLAEVRRLIEMRDPARPVRLRYLVVDWVEESFTDGQSAMARLDQLTGGATFGGDRAIPVYERQAIDRLLRASDHRLKPLLQLWRASFNQLNDATLPFLVRNGYDRRMMIAERKPNSRDHIFRYIGADYTFYGEADRFRLIGAELRQQPDRDYGEWVARAYSEASSKMQPLYDIVDAVIRPPGQPLQRRRYERLLLPFGTADGSVMVIGSSVLCAEADAAGQ